MKGAIRKDQLLAMVPLGENSIRRLEKRGLFPKRFQLTPRTVAWNLDKVQAWLDDCERKYLQSSNKAEQKS